MPISRNEFIANFSARLRATEEGGEEGTIHVIKEAKYMADQLEKENAAPWDPDPHGHRSDPRFFP